MRRVVSLLPVASLLALALLVGCQGPASQVATPEPLATATVPAPGPATASPSHTATALPSVPTPIPTLSGLPSPTPTATLTATPTAPQAQALTFENRPPTPDLDIYAVARRLRPGTDPKRPQPPTRQRVGETTEFWAFNLDTTTAFRVSAVLRAATPHGDFYVQEGLAIPEDDIQAAARLFEQTVYPQVSEGLGPLNDSGALALVHLSLPAVAGYYDSGSEFPPELSPYSNGRPALFLNTTNMRPGSTAYAGLVAHELQHAIHWTVDPTEEVWVNEGLSVLASALVEPDDALIQAFLVRPLTQLTAWPDQPGSTAPYYGAAGLFLEFLRDRYPGRDGTVRALVAQPEDGLDGVSAYLAEQGYGIGWRQVLVEWATANYLDGRSSWDPYPSRRVAVRPARTLREPGSAQVQSPQFAGHYTSLSLAPGDYRVSFQGGTRTRLLPNGDEAGFWWSGGEDAADATLTRAFDLRGVASATLSLRLWYDIEEDWDHAYLLASRDSGRSWEVLAAPHTSARNPVGQSFGPSYTGRSGGPSGPAWIEERVDLSAYAGQQVLLRLEYITDGATSLDGIALAGAAIPETGYAWDGQGDGGWEAAGFFLSNGWARQEYEVRLLLVKADGSSEVLSVPLDAAQRGAISLRGLGAAYREAALLVFPLAPATRQPATFTYQVERLP